MKKSSGEARNGSAKRSNQSRRNINIENGRNKAGSSEVELTGRLNKALTTAAERLHEIIKLKKIVERQEAAMVRKEGDCNDLKKQLQRYRRANACRKVYFSCECVHCSPPCTSRVHCG